jgi:hypothetical protein
MKISRFALLASIAIGSAVPAQAQVPTFDTAAVSAGCAASACSAAAQAAISQILGSGLTGSAYSAQIALLASMLYSMAQNGQISVAEAAAALRTVAANSTDATQRAAILAAAINLENGNAGSGTPPSFEASPN